MIACDRGHRDGAAIALQFDSGAISVRCLHNSCAGWDWATLRESREPGYQKKAPSEQFRQEADDAAAQAPHVKKASAASRLITLALERARLWQSPHNDPWATITRDGHHEHWAIHSRVFRMWLAAAFFEAEKHPPHTQALQEALDVVGSHALLRGPTWPVFRRVAHTEEAIYLDLGDAAWRAVEITSAGWRIVPIPPVRFARAKGMLPLPEPQPDGDIGELRTLLNVNDSAWRLILAWLTATLSAGPYPLLALHGEQGTAKSTTAKLLRDIVDPHVAGLRAPPRELRDLAIAANNQWIGAFDNLSYLPDWLSDGLARLATGGGFATRQLYTDSDEVLFEGRRPIILNGIIQTVVRGDLADRSIILELEPIPDHKRRTEAELRTAFAAVHPQVLGALCTAVATGLQRRTRVHLERLPRMADFAVWAAAVAPGLGLDEQEIVVAYQRNRGEATRDVIEAHTVGPVLCRWAAGVGCWTGSAAEMLNALSQEASEQERRSRDWPATPRGLVATLKRLAPALRGVGVTVQSQGYIGRGHAKRAAWHVEYSPLENEGE